jgi:hypothetical protein
MPQRTLAASSRADYARRLSGILCRHLPAVNRQADKHQWITSSCVFP